LGRPSLLLSAPFLVASYVIDAARRRASIRGMLAIQICGAQLRSARVYVGMTLEEVAARAGIARQTLNAWELSSAAVPPARVDKLGRVVSVLESAGVRFTDSGVSLHRPAPMILTAPAEAIA
jgi:Helix-turn-helix